MSDALIKVYLISQSIWVVAQFIIFYIMIRIIVDMRDDINRIMSWWPFVELCKVNLKPEEIDKIQKEGKLDDDVR